LNIKLFNECFLTPVLLLMLYNISFAKQIYNIRSYFVLSRRKISSSLSSHPLYSICRVIWFIPNSFFNKVSTW